MDEKTLTTLEFDKIIARLARLTAFSAGRLLAESLRPASDLSGAVWRQRQTAEARRLRFLKPNVGLGGAHDVRDTARKAALGGVLEPSELLEIASTVQAAIDLRNTILRFSEELPLLSGVARSMPPLPELVAETNRCISPRAEVTDAASPLLGTLRRDVRIAHDRLNSRLQEILSSPSGRQAAQEPIVTLRDGRYVIPVKADFRGQIQGIIHDVSSSGATVFLEPLAVVDLGNTWRELQLEEEREVERVLRRLSGAVGAAAEEIASDVEGLAQIDLALAKARLADQMGCSDLPYEGEAQPWLVEAPAPLNLVKARHPLLTGQVVPVTVAVGGSSSALLITGPNTGGKTVVLKTTGLLTLMALAGLPVPADAGTQIPAFASVHADIGDEQSIEQSLSTFSSHMTNIIGILRQAGASSLVLLDELAAGTDPVEGSALARAILQHLLSTGCLTVATTHHGELKAFAHTTPGITNASVEFDPETLAPTYRLSIGLPGRSNALAIAARLGLDEPIVEEARRGLAPGHIAVDDLLSDIQRERTEAAASRKSEEVARREAEQIRAGLEERLDAIEEERAQILETARRELQADLAEAREMLEQARRRAEKAAATAARPQARRAALEAAKEKVAAAEEVAQRVQEKARRRRRRADAGPAPETIQPGDLVWIRGFDRFGEALTAPDERGEIELRLGALHSRVRLDQVERVQRVRARAPKAPEIDLPPVTIEVEQEVDIRGKLTDEALPLIDKYLDDAYRAGLASLRIVHGKGTGALRRAVRDLLHSHPLVRTFETAPPPEGGDGVTVVTLAG